MHVQWFWYWGLVAPQHVKSSQTCPLHWQVDFNHWTTMDILSGYFEKLFLTFDS